MGREEAAKAERAELRRAVVDEALGRVSELEEKIASHKKIINRQGVAMEAMANAITAFGRDVMALQAEARRPRGWRRLVAYFRGVVETVREAQAVDRQGMARKAGSVSIRRVAEPALGEPEPVAEVFDRRALERLKAEAAPRPDHLHQYEKDGPFQYRCRVDGCGRRATMEEIAAESEYLLQSAGAGSKEH